MVFSLDEEFPISEMQDPPPDLISNGTCIMKPALTSNKDDHEVLSFSDEDGDIGRNEKENQPYHKNLMQLNPRATPLHTAAANLSIHVPTKASLGFNTAEAEGINSFCQESNINSAHSKLQKISSSENLISKHSATMKSNCLKIKSDPCDPSGTLAVPIGSQRPEGRGPRRRSSVLSRLSINTPPNVVRIGISAPKAEALVFDDEEKSDEDFADACGMEFLSLNNSKPVVGHTTETVAIGGNVTSTHTLKRKIEDFQPVRVLGQGAYGKVVLVKDQYNAKLYAMKQLKKAEILVLPDDENEKNQGGMSPRSKRIERTFAERTILSTLEHPNIVKLFYSFHDADKLYLLLQYLPGGELFFHLKNLGNLEEDTVAFYTAEISLAMKFLHEKGIVYRDLKPENCLLNERGHLVLTDFGLSKSSHGGDGNFYSIIGTPEYAAPELLQGVAYTKLCDWYSLGCLVYDMLTGKPPYTGQNPKVILNKIMKNTLKVPYYLSEGMKDFVNAILKKDVEKRWNVDLYWDESLNKSKGKATDKKRKKKAGAAKTSGFKQHFIFRKINWKDLETPSFQKCTFGPIMPVITDWSLAENFDLEFTEQKLQSGDIRGVDMSFPAGHANSAMHDELFKGFSFTASSSYLDRYF
ncbi:hypothetical protein ACO0QE_001452 [Hanseniaspora vineae]